MQRVLLSKEMKNNSKLTNDTLLILHFLYIAINNILDSDNQFNLVCVWCVLYIIHRIIFDTSKINTHRQRDIRPLVEARAEILLKKS